MPLGRKVQNSPGFNWHWKTFIGIVVGKFVVIIQNKELNSSNPAP